MGDTRFFWMIRRALDRLVGGKGGSASCLGKEMKLKQQFDCWQVDAIDHPFRVRLSALMMLPGLAWLEILLIRSNNELKVYFVTIFQPKGFVGKLYWQLTSRLHQHIFRRMFNNLMLSMKG